MSLLRPRRKLGNPWRIDDMRVAPLTELYSELAAPRSESLTLLEFGDTRSPLLLTLP